MRFFRPSHLLFVVLALTACVGGGVRDPQALADCNQREEPERTIDGCTTLLLVGKLNQRQRIAALSLRSAAFLKTEDDRRAMLDAKEILSIDAESAIGWSRKHSVHLHRGEGEKAIEAAMREIEFSDGHSRGYLNLAAGYLISKKYEEAIAVADTIEAQAPDDAAAMTAADHVRRIARDQKRAHIQRLIIALMLGVLAGAEETETEATSEDE
ncbi:MAG: hypothetical protein AAFN79_10415 [Pseudomonadota bacterium]